MRYVDKLLESYGCLTYELKGRRIVRTPYAEFPNEEFLEEHWSSEQLGHVRSVLRREDMALLSKHAEYSFTSDKEQLDRGMIWIRDRMYPHVNVSGSTVEEQIDWEAIFLLELLKNDIKAEVPQAVVEYYGNKRLIVKGIESPTLKDIVEGRCNLKNDTNSIQKAEELGLKPIDVVQNNLVDTNGYQRIIDVSRWLWPPHTDEFHSRLVSLIRERIPL